MSMDIDAFNRWMAIEFVGATVMMVMMWALYVLPRTNSRMDIGE